MSKGLHGLIGQMDSFLRVKWDFKHQVRAGSIGKAAETQSNMVRLAPCRRFLW
jgi:hypothetical protein